MNYQSTGVDPARVALMAHNLQLHLRFKWLESTALDMVSRFTLEALEELEADQYRRCKGWLPGADPIVYQAAHREQKRRRRQLKAIERLDWSYR